MKNKYCIRSRISEAKFREIIRFFSADIEAKKISELTGISEKTLGKIFQKIRERMAEICENQAKFSGTLEVDESYFGAKRVAGKRGRGSTGKIPVFGILKRDGKVFTKIVKGVSKADLRPIIRGQILEGSTINSDGWKAYDGLILDGYKHHRVYHCKDEFARGKSHINGIESFWGITKVRLTKFRGISKNKFYFHLKESEFRFNLRNKNIYLELLKILKNSPLKFY